MLKLDSFARDGSWASARLFLLRVIAQYKIVPFDSLISVTSCQPWAQVYEMKLLEL
jgi:hypothetical protein